MFEVISTGRKAQCKICFRTIDGDELKIIANLGSGRYAYSYHIRCFLKEYGNEIRDLNKMLPVELL